MFFSVKMPIKIAGKIFQPCICYKLTPLLENNVNKLVTEGKAVLYTKEVFFQNGKIIEKSEPVVKQEVKVAVDKKATKTKRTEAPEEPKVEASDTEETF